MIDDCHKHNTNVRTNEQLAHEVKALRGRICKLTIGVGAESEFPSINQIAITYEAISSNDRLNLTSEIIKQLKKDERINSMYEKSFLTRFAHCVSFTILKLSYQFVKSYWDQQLQYLQKPFGLSNEETAQRYFQTMFQEQFRSSLKQLCSRGKKTINSELKQEIIKENQNFTHLLNSIDDQIAEQKGTSEINVNKDELIESCLQSMWSCLLSRPSLKPYPLMFTSNPQFNDKIKSKNLAITEELSEQDDCNNIGYFTWPGLVRSDSGHLLYPVAACRDHFHVGKTSEETRAATNTQRNCPDIEMSKIGRSNGIDTI
ncbi:hypothetical protein RFI_33968 [Reticulomyxa filosa]|uniref:Uncharacterized protein n=1 Tax=Reticulomyxa filosa TaxID=46433 RepID=X6LPZ9_RETFI|nr:hypothetical protein RFI_33968 [Reticulomyxa filosa]|eukprot:ETO03441.1 hypothetical protein RFI_33968 [Reticulomyxa filosa]